MGQRQHLEHAAVDDLLDHVGAVTSAPRVSKTACAQGVHLLRLAARAGSRAPGRRPRTAAGTPRPCGAGGAPAPPRARRTAPAPTCRCRPGRRARRCRPRGRAAGRARSAARRERPCSPNASRSPRTSRTCLSGVDPAQRAAALGEQHQAGVAGQVAGLRRGRARSSSYSSSRSAAGRPRPRPCRSSRTRRAELGAVLLGVQPDRRRLDPHRQVLGDQRDVVALGGEVAGDREDPGVVVAEPEAGGQRRRVGVVELDPQRAAVVADRDRLVEPAVRDPQVVEQPQRRAGEVAELGVVPLGLQLGDHHDRAAPPRARRSGSSAPRVGQQDAGVEDVGADGGRQLPRRVSALDTAAATVVPSRTGTRTRAPGPESSTDRDRARGPSAGPPDALGRDALHERASRAAGADRRPLLGRYAADTAGPARHARRVRPGDVADRATAAQAPKRRSRCGVGAQRAQEVDPAEVGPVGLAEVELECALCQSRKPDSRCSPDVRITRSGSGWPLV